MSAVADDPIQEIAAATWLEKFCGKCSTTKPAAEFYLHRRHKSGLSDWCIACIKARRIEEREHDTEQMRHRALCRRYGIEVEDYERMLEEQGYRCAICHIPVGFYPNRNRLDVAKFSVDHCHETGKVRGLLCTCCNRGLGYFWDSIEFLKSAIDYLENHPETTFESVMGLRGEAI